MAFLSSYDVTSYQMCISLISLPLSPSHSGYKGLGCLAAKTMFIRARESWNKRKKGTQVEGRVSSMANSCIFVLNKKAISKKLIRNGTSQPLRLAILLNR